MDRELTEVDALVSFVLSAVRSAVSLVGVYLRFEGVSRKALWI